MALVALVSGTLASNPKHTRADKNPVAVKGTSIVLLQQMLYKYVKGDASV